MLDSNLIKGIPTLQPYTWNTVFNVSLCNPLLTYESLFIHLVSSTDLFLFIILSNMIYIGLVLIFALFCCCNDPVSLWETFKFLLISFNTSLILQEICWCANYFSTIVVLSGEWIGLLCCSSYFCILQNVVICRHFLSRDTNSSSQNMRIVLYQHK